MWTITLNDPSDQLRFVQINQNREYGLRQIQSNVHAQSPPATPNERSIANRAHARVIAIPTAAPAAAAA